MVSPCSRDTHPHYESGNVYVYVCVCSLHSPEWVRAETSISKDVSSTYLRPNIYKIEDTTAKVYQSMDKIKSPDHMFLSNPQWSTLIAQELINKCWFKLIQIKEIDHQTIWSSKQWSSKTMIIKNWSPLGSCIWSTNAAIVDPDLSTPHHQATAFLRRLLKFRRLLGESWWKHHTKTSLDFTTGRMMNPKGIELGILWDSLIFFWHPL